MSKPTPTPTVTAANAAIVAFVLDTVNSARVALRDDPAALKALADGLHIAGSRVLESYRKSKE